MRYPKTAQWIDALRYLINATDAPPGAQTSAQHALNAYDYACRLHADEKQVSFATLQSLHTLERDISTTTLAKVQAGKRPNLDTMLREIEQTRVASQLARQRAEITQRVETWCESKVCGAALVEHRDSLVQWIATRRTKAGHQCGEVDTLPTAVQIIHDRVRPTWLQNWDDALALEGMSHLPLLYNAAWDKTVRASLAWVWEQVATGNIETVPHPNATNPERAARVTMPTRRVVNLPTVLK